MDHFSDQLDEEEFVAFCEHIKVEDHSLLVFRLRAGVSYEAAKGILDAVSEIIKNKLGKKAGTLIVGPDIDSVTLIPEKEMNEMGWFKKEK